MRRIATLTVTMLMGAVVSIIPGLSSPAQATWEQCQQGGLCGWHNTAYQGTYNRYTGTTSDMGSNSDEWDSIRNYTNVIWYVYDDKDFKGTVRCIRPGKGTRNLGNFGLHDKISSVAKLGSGASCAGIPEIS